MLEQSERPPPAEAKRQTVSLPDRWSERRPEAGGSGWYRFVVDPRDAEGRWALLLDDLNMNAEVFVDGEWVGGGGSFEPPVAQHWNRPLLVSFDGAALRDGAVIDVRLFAYAGDWGGLGPLYLGPREVLAPAFDAQLAAQVVPAQVASVLALVMVVLFGALWLANGREPMYGYFVLAAGCYFVHSLSFHLRDIHVPFWFGRWSIHVALDGFGVWQLRAFHRWVGLERRRLENGVLAFVGLGSLVTLAISLLYPAHFIAAAVFVHVGTIALLPYALVTMARRWSRLRRVEAAIVMAGTLAISAVAFHAMLAHLGVLPQNAPRMLYVVGPILLICFGAVMLMDFLRAFRTAQLMNVELDRRVKDKEAELATNYERLRKLENARLLAEERERIMREMHDGMGSSLVSTLSLVENSGSDDRNVIAGALRDTLIDMRVVIDSLDPSVDDLTTMLGMLRSRLAPRLAEGGLDVRWEVEDLPTLAGWSPQHTLHTMRIVQEAITNVLKHARAQTIGVTTGVRDAGPFVRIWDDGCGIEDAAGGRGQRNMRLRARELGGRVTVEPRPDGGTSVTLWLPAKLTQSSSDKRPRLTAS